MLAELQEAGLLAEDAAAVAAAGEAPPEDGEDREAGVVAEDSVVQEAAASVSEGVDHSAEEVAVEGLGEGAAHRAGGPHLAQCNGVRRYGKVILICTAFLYSPGVAIAGLIPFSSTFA